MSQLELPAWGEELRARYLAGEASLFLLHGNIRDLFAWQDGANSTEWIGIREFLQRFLGRTRDIVTYYNVSQGLLFADKASETQFRRSVDTRRLLDGQPKLGVLPTVPSSTIPLIESLITDPLQSSGVVVDFFEMIAPQGDVSFMTTEDKANLVSMMRWSSDPAFLSTDNLVILLTEHLSDVSRRVLASPQLVTISVAYPNANEREGFLTDHLVGGAKAAMSPEVLVKITAGLSLIQIRSLVRGADQTGKPIDFNTVSRRKKTIIEQECHGLVEFVEPGHNFSHVGGMERVKKDLLEVANAVKQGHKNRVPMGMIFVGPMGTGKTFVAEAFAAESGLTCLKFENFREKWVGSTESNLEKVLELVDALGFVLLIIDEADRSLSSGESDGGTSSRVIARLKEFMSDTSHRGRVVVLMMTNRPDKLDADLKRPGRFDLKVPFFFPETADERRLIFEALVRKNRLTMAEELDLTSAAEQAAGYSGAELEAILLSAANLASREDRVAITSADVELAVKDVIPSRDKRMLEYMEMLAVFECSARRMLPDRHVDLDTSEVLERLDVLRAQLGRRVR